MFFLYISTFCFYYVFASDFRSFNI